MPELAYRLHFGDRPATQEELDRVEEIQVEQEADMAWEARIRLFLCVGEDGRWRHGAHEFTEPFSRVRVEIGVDGGFVPLIDGPVAGYDTDLDALPGKSAATLVVRDDSVLLNREEEVEVFRDRSDHELARELFGRFPEIADTRIESTEGTPPAAVRRGTVMQFLRDLARVHGYHAYVLPGERPGRSVGCFLPDPAEPGSLPALVLLGPDRSLASFQVREDSEGPERTRSRSLTLADQRVTDAETSHEDVELLRPLPAIAEDAAAIRLVRPEDVDREDPAPRTRAQATRAALAYTATGRVLPDCYRGVLAPYQRVVVRAGDLPHSGAWLITKVTHRITPHVYTQEFEARSNAREEPEAAALGALPGGVGVSVDFSASISVF